MKRICKAIDCNKEVKTRDYPGKPREYCSTQCRDREKQRRYRKMRLKKGLCPQCGKEMNKLAFPYQGKIPQYCPECQEYFRERYRKKVEEN